MRFACAAAGVAIAAGAVVFMFSLTATNRAQAPALAMRAAAPWAAWCFDWPMGPRGGVKGFKEFKEFKVVKESKVSNDLKDSNDPNDPKDLNDLNDLKDSNDLKVIKDAAAVADLPFPEDGPVGVVCQTTLSCGTVQDVLSALRARYPHLLESPASGTCTATRDRQRAVDDFVRSGDPSATGVLVIGSANSSNTARLVEIACEAGVAAWRVDGPEELASCDFAGIERLGLTAGASTPEAIVADIAARLGRT